MNADMGFRLLLEIKLYQRYLEFRDKEFLNLNNFSMEFENIFQEIILSMKKSLELNLLCDHFLKDVPPDFLSNQYDIIRMNLSELFPQYSSEELEKVQKLLKRMKNQTYDLEVKL